MLKVSRPPLNELNELLATCNYTAMANGQPPLYSEESDFRQTEVPVGIKLRGSHAMKKAVVLDRSDAFHVSIGWSLTSPTDEDENLVREQLKTREFKEITDITVRVLEVKVKIGNEVTSIGLPKNIVPETSLFGF